MDRNRKRDRGRQTHTYETQRETDRQRKIQSDRETHTQRE